MAYAITRDGPVAVPYTYKLAQGESFEVESISAVWNGAGASGSFLPCVSVYSQDGKLLGRFKGDITVSAGDSFTEATFAPFLKGVPQAAAPSGSGVPTVATFYTRVSGGDSPITVGAGATVNLTWAHAALPSDGSITGPIIGNAFASINMNCIAIQYLRVGWEDGAYSKACVIGTNSRDVQADVVSPANWMNGASPLNVDTLDWVIDAMPGAFITGDLSHCYAINGDVVARNVQEAYYVIQAWPATGYAGGIPGYPV